MTKTLSADTIRLCEQSAVTVDVRPMCPGLAINIVFIVDEVYKIGYSNPADRTEALRTAGGLLHALLGVDSMARLLVQPWVGGSWEGWIIGQL